MTAMIKKKCACCKAEIEVRLTDHKRGWGRFCSKSCKAKRQTQLTGVSGPEAAIKGVSVPAYRSGKRAPRQHSRVIEVYDDGTELFYANWSNEEGSDI